MTCEYCDTLLDQDGDCAKCTAEMERQQSFYGALYRAESHYTREEIEDSLSDSTETTKRKLLLERLGL